MPPDEESLLPQSHTAVSDCNNPLRVLLAAMTSHSIGFHMPWHMHICMHSCPKLHSYHCMMNDTHTSSCCAVAVQAITVRANSVLELMHELYNNNNIYLHTTTTQTQQAKLAPPPRASYRPSSSFFTRVLGTRVAPSHRVSE